jgi:hypothetical protein
MYNMSKTTTYGVYLVVDLCLSSRFVWIGTRFFSQSKEMGEQCAWMGTFLPHANGPLGLASEMFVFSYEALVRSANTASEIEALHWV